MISSYRCPLIALYRRMAKVDPTSCFVHPSQTRLITTDIPSTPVPTAVSPYQYRQIPNMDSTSYYPLRENASFLKRNITPHTKGSINTVNSWKFICIRQKSEHGFHTMFSSLLTRSIKGLIASCIVPTAIIPYRQVTAWLLDRWPLRHRSLPNMDSTSYFKSIVRPP